MIKKIIQFLLIGPIFLINVAHSNDGNENSLLPENFPPKNIERSHEILEPPSNDNLKKLEFLSVIDDITSTLENMKQSEDNIKISLYCNKEENLVMLRVALPNVEKEDISPWDAMFYFEINKSLPPIEIKKGVWGKILSSVSESVPESKEYKEANLNVGKSENFQNILEIASWNINPFYTKGILEKLKVDFNHALEKDNTFQIVEKIGNLDQQKYTNDKNYFIRLLQNFGQIYFPRYSGRIINTLSDLKKAIKESQFNPTVEGKIL